MLLTINRCDEEDEKYKELQKQKKQYQHHYSNVCKSGFNSQVVKYLKTYLCDNDFYDKLDDGLYRMVFQNGILDLKTLQFRNGIRQDDFITKTIKFDFKMPTKDEVEYVRENLKKICNYNDEHLDYYLSSLGYALTGDSSKEQNFWYLRGQTAENGKSIIFENLEILMPNYVCKANSDILDKGADLRKEVATWKGIKILWLNEVSTKRKDEDVVKALCDGTGYKYNRLYSTEAVVMLIAFKLFAVSNNTLTIKGDAGVKRRFKLEQFNSQFKDEFECDYEKLQFKKDKTFGEKLCGEYKNALLYLLCTYSNHYWVEKKLKDYPVEWKDEADQAMEDNNKFSEWFRENFDIHPDSRIRKDQFESILQCSKYKDIDLKHIKDNLTCMKISYTYNSQFEVSIDKKRYKGLWTGFKQKMEEVSDEE